jgi:hypothetical protein
MPGKTLTPAEVAKVRDTLDLARAGRATLVQLAVAHDLASGASLNGCLGELRSHILRMVTPAPPHAGPATIATKDLTLGIVSGILTHMILRDV